MFIRCEKNPIIRPEDVKPSSDGYQVIGAFNPGAIRFNDEVILLLRVAEKCVLKPGKIRVPIYRFSNGKGNPDIMEFDEKDPDLSLKDTRGVVYQGKDYLSTVSHLRVARSSDGINWEKVVEFIREEVLEKPQEVLCKECHRAETDKQNESKKK